MELDTPTSTAASTSAKSVIAEPEIPFSWDLAERIELKG
jgi:hypothetical protein